MPSPSSSARNLPAFIQQGRITEIDPARWICKVRPAGESSDIQVSIPSLYSHPVNGEGIHFMPEVGAVCYICRSSDSPGLPFLLLAGAATVPKDRPRNGGAPGSLDMFRPLMAPGDIALLTRDGNGLTLRRGGVTELRGTALSKLLINPLKNQIFVIAENFRIQTFGGDLEWKNLRRDQDSDGELRTQYSFSVKEFASSKGYSVRTRFGTTEEDPVAIRPSDSTDQTEIVEEEVSLVLSGTGEEYTVKVPKVVSLNNSSRVVDFRVFADETKDIPDLTTSMSLGIDREGDVLLQTAGAARLEISQWLEIAVEGNTPAIKTDGQGVRKVLITSGEQGATEAVLKGQTFLQDLSNSLLEISSILKGLGIPTPATDLFLTNVDSPSNPYLSSTLESE